MPKEQEDRFIHVMSQIYGTSLIRVSKALSRFHLLAAIFTFRRMVRILDAVKVRNLHILIETLLSSIDVEAVSRNLTPEYREC